MIPKLREVLEILDNIAPSRLSEPWDNSGMQVGSYSQEIKRILVALDPSLNIVDSAQELDAQLVLTHHPLIFGKFSSLNINVYPGDVLLEAARNGIAIVAAHTNLDMAKGGLNDILAELLDLQNVEVLQKLPDIPEAGLGRIGDLVSPKTVPDMVKSIKGILDTEKIRLAGVESVLVKRVAVVGGSGGSLISLAAEKNADLYLTGDVGHHHALEAKTLGLALIDGGHFQTEKTALKIFTERLGSFLQKQDLDVQVYFEDNEKDPTRYF